MLLSEKDIQEQFEHQTFVRGWHYQKTRKVLDVSVHSVFKDEWVVQGSKKYPYEVSVEKEPRMDRSNLQGFFQGFNRK